MDKKQVRIKSYPSPEKALKETFGKYQFFLLYGTVGSGKSTFVRLYLEKIGLEYAGSPTFNLLNEYNTLDGKRIIHTDLYRLKTGALSLLNDYLNGGHVIFIEWPPSGLEKIFPIDKTVQICFD